MISGKFDTCPRHQLLKKKCFITEKLPTTGNLSIVAFIEEVHLSVLEEKDFEYQKYHIPHIYESDLTEKNKQRTQRNVRKKFKFALWCLRLG